MSGKYTTGWATMADGTRRSLSRDEIDAILEESERAERRRAETMPDEQSAINAMFQAWLRLKELGWREAEYCPKDGTSFDVIEAGSTGIFACHYTGEWPNGTWWCYDGGDLWPSRPVLFRAAIANKEGA